MCFIEIKPKMCYPVFFVCFSDRVSLCNSPDYSGTHFVDQAGLKFRDLPVLTLAGLKSMCHHLQATMSFLWVNEYRKF